MGSDVLRALEELSEAQIAELPPVLLQAMLGQVERDVLLSSPANFAEKLSDGWAMKTGEQIAASDADKYVDKCNMPR